MDGWLIYLWYNEDWRPMQITVSEAWADWAVEQFRAAGVAAFAMRQVVE
jgi:hypothetical protein